MRNLSMPRLAGLLLCSTLVGLAVGRSDALAAAMHLTRPVLLVIAVLLAVFPFLLLRWKAALAVFLVWLVVEDLMRKLAGNNISIYFVKDLFLICLLIGVSRDPELGSSWRLAAGRPRLILYGLMAWAVLLSIPSAFVDWRLPLIGLRLDFLYLPLTAVGYLLARNRSGLQSGLLIGAIVGAAACVVGLVQAVLGPGFLSPAAPTPGLSHLVLIRGIGASDAVYRPTGTFVDPSRFLSMALVTLAVALALTIISSRKTRALAAAAALIAVAAVWVSGGRTGLIEGAVMAAVAVIASVTNRSGVVRRTVVLLAAVIGALVLIWWFIPDLVNTRLLWYSATLDPASAQNEWASRWTNYSSDTLRGIAEGGLMGRGTGQESLGKQYLLGGPEISVQGLYRVEGGYAAVGVEWGVVGVLLWLAWSVSWFVRQARSAIAAQSSALRSAGAVLTSWMLFYLFLGFFAGLQEFQNYLSNAYFWLLSGMIFSLPWIRIDTDDAPSRTSRLPRQAAGGITRARDTTPQRESGLVARRRP